MTITFITESGSRYELNRECQQLRRLSGSEDPTSRQGKDGDWKRYASISPIVLGQAVIISWAEEKLMPETQALIKTGLFSGGIPITYTSRITSIEGE